ncbi:glycoside hydrolase family 16 protein [Sphaerobolus stellatus SS14]|nr:glycoside hydrolase family 16 protein [Sphaerobolus stellatus SS14]
MIMILRVFCLQLFLCSTLYAFQLVREYSGASFFDRWEFYGSWDNLTNGDVNWVDRNTAWSENLIGVNAAGNVIIRVDNATNVPFNFKRDTVRITSTDVYDLGSLWIFDVAHLPWGCSVWPAIWTKGMNWPEGGEIDIVEGVNLNPQNQVALHTEPGCFQKTGAQLGQSGQDPDCSTPSGCTVIDTTPQASFGQGFAQVGGGIWAAQFDVAGIFIWFWNRTNIPVSLHPSSPTNNLDISDWGVPVASYPSVACNMPQFFGSQQLVIDITLCGDWAGIPQVYPQTCANQQPNSPVPSGVIRTGPTCYPDNVPGPGSPRFDNAYFELAHIRAYTVQAAPTSAPSSAQEGQGVATINGTTVTLLPNTEIPNANVNNGAIWTTLLGIIIGVFLV